MSEVATGPANEDGIVNPPWTYSGSAQRIFRLRRRVDSPVLKALATVLAVVLVIPAWVLVTFRYLLWGLWRGEQAEAEATFEKDMLKATPGPAVLPHHEPDDRP